MYTSKIRFYYSKYFFYKKTNPSLDIRAVSSGRQNKIIFKIIKSVYITARPGKTAKRAERTRKKSI